MQITLNKSLLPHEEMFMRQALHSLESDKRLSTVSDVLGHLVWSVAKHNRKQLHHMVKAALMDMKNENWIRGYDYIRIGPVLVVIVTGMNGKKLAIRYRLL